MNDLPSRPFFFFDVSQTAASVWGQNTHFQTLYLQKWPKSAFEVVVMVERASKNLCCCSRKIYKCEPCFLPKKCPLYGERGAWSSGEPDFAFRASCPIGILLGIAFPKPCPTQPDGCGNLVRRQSFTSSIGAQGYKKFGKTGVKITLPMPTQWRKISLRTSSPQQGQKSAL